MKTFVTACALIASSIHADAGQLRIASAEGSVPFEFEDSEGKTVGFEIDLITEIAKRMGDTVDVTPMPFNSLFAAVQSGRADIAIGSITITDKRMESVSFAQPYYDGDQCLTVTSSGDFKSLADLTGQAVGAETGSSGEIWAKNNQPKYEWSDIRLYEGVSPAMLDLAAGRISADINDCPIAEYYIKGKDQYRVLASISSGEKYSMMFPKDSHILEPVNEIISGLKKDGTLARLNKQWFGAEPHPESSTVIVEPIPTAK